MNRLEKDNFNIRLIAGIGFILYSIFCFSYGVISFFDIISHPSTGLSEMIWFILGIIEFLLVLCLGVFAILKKLKFLTLIGFFYWRYYT